MKRLLIFWLCSFGVASCGGGGSTSPTSPSTSSPTPAATSLITIAGFVSSQAGTRLPGASVAIVDGVNAGRGSTADATGTYQITNVTPVGGTVQARAAGYDPQNASFSNVSTTLNFALRTSVPWSQSGIGDSVFTIPSYVTRIRIDATYSGSCQNFIVHLSTSVTSLVNVIIGTCSIADSRSPFSGTYAISGGGQISMTSSTGINWTFTEVR